MLLIPQDKCFVNKNVHYYANVCCNVTILDLIVS